MKRNNREAYYSTSEPWDDGVIDPVDTRNALDIGISALLNAPLGLRCPPILVELPLPRD
jgi:3-methylcrotonyl-CoA carboxylase beta subunit